MNQTFRWNQGIEITIVYLFLGNHHLLLAFALGISIKTDYIYKSIFPLTPLNWFARSYLLLYVSIPYLIKSFNSVSKARLGQIIIVLTTIFYTVPTLISTFISGGGYLTSYFTFGIMYMIGAYIRKYGDAKLDKISIYAGIMSIILILASILWNDIHMHEGLYIMYLAP